MAVPIIHHAGLLGILSKIFKRLLLHRGVEVF